MIASTLTHQNSRRKSHGVLVAPFTATYVRAANILCPIEAFTDVSASANGRVQGTLTATTGYLYLTAGGDIRGTLTAGTSLQAQSYSGSLAGEFAAGTYVSGLTAAKSLTGTVTSGGDISSLSAGTGINALVSAHGSIYTLDPGSGDLAGTLTAATGSLPDITCAHASLLANLSAATTIGNLSASQNIAGTILATGDIGTVTAGYGDISANITSTGGAIGDLLAGHNLTGNMSAQTIIGDVVVAGTMSGCLFTNTGSIGTIITVGDITNTAFIHGGNGNVAVWTFANVAGGITASANITLFVSGTISGDIFTTFGDEYISAGVVSGTIVTIYGNVVISAGGDITSQTVSGASDIVMLAGGNITSGRIFTTNDISLTAGDNIFAPDIESTETGIVSETAGGTITTHATSPVDVWMSAAAISGSTACVAGKVTSVNIGGRACFVAGTRVLLANQSSCPIEALTEGMAILAVPEDDPTATPVARRIVQVFRRPPTRIFEVQVDSHTLRTTARHRFFVRHRGWVEACGLLPGDQLQTPAGEFLAVASTKETNDFEPVFNFEVDCDHTYFVLLADSNRAILVHNDQYEDISSPTSDAIDVMQLQRAYTIVFHADVNTGNDRVRQEAMIWAIMLTIADHNAADLSAARYYRKVIADAVHHTNEQLSELKKRVDQLEKRLGSINSDAMSKPVEEVRDLKDKIETITGVLDKFEAANQFFDGVTTMKGGDPGNVLIGGATALEAVASVMAVAPGVGQMLKFYTSAMTAIGGKMNELYQAREEQNLDLWRMSAKERTEKGGLPGVAKNPNLPSMSSDIRFGMPWARKVVADRIDKLKRSGDGQDQVLLKHLEGLLKKLDAAGSAD